MSIPKGVSIKADATGVDVKGPNGPMKRRIRPASSPPWKTADRHEESWTIAELNKFHGLARSLVEQRRDGVTEGWKKELDIRGRLPRGVAGRAGGAGSRIHPPGRLRIPKGIKITVEKQTHVTVTGVDRQQVGQVAAEIRGLRRRTPTSRRGFATWRVLKKKVGKTGA